MKRRTQKLAAALIALAAVAIAWVTIDRARATAHPCAEPADLPVPRERVVRCVERYVEDQWYTTHWGKFGALDADPHGHGSWLELMSKHRKTLDSELTHLCTHPKDTAGSLGHVAIFESLAKNESDCRVFSITPLLGVALKDQTCASVRERSACVPR